MAFCSYFKIQPVAGGADRIKKSEWKLVSHDNSQPPPRAGTAAAFYRFRLPASYCQPPAFVEPLSLCLFRVRSSLSSTFRFSVSFSSCVLERSNFFHLFPHDATRCDATPRFSVTLLFQSVSRYRHTTIANAYTKGHFVDRFKYGRCMRAKPFSRSRI